MTCSSIYGIGIIMRFLHFVYIGHEFITLFIQYPTSRDFVARSAALKPDIFYPEIHEVDLWQVYTNCGSRSPNFFSNTVCFWDMKLCKEIRQHRTLIDKIFIFFRIVLRLKSGQTVAKWKRNFHSISTITMNVTSWVSRHDISVTPSQDVTRR